MEDIDPGSISADEGCVRVGLAAGHAAQCHHDWRVCYEIRFLLALARPCGAWIRACAAASPRQRLLTMVSCRDT
jgi:hypothetical protein